MIQRLFTLFSGVCILFFGYLSFHTSGDTVVEADAKSKKYSIIEHKINKASKAPYTGCEWIWSTLDDIGLWKQDCSIENKKVTIIPNEATHAFYYAIDEGHDYKVDKLALQIFDSENTETVEDILDSIYLNLLKSGSIKLEWVCNFEEISSIHQNYPTYRLVSSKMNEHGKQICGDYGFSSKENKYFLIIKAAKSKAVFINQVQKNLFDVKSLRILD